MKGVRGSGFSRDEATVTREIVSRPGGRSYGRRACANLRLHRVAWAASGAQPTRQRSSESDMSNGSDQPVYDIFVSYAHVNNEPRPPVPQGWVSTFVEIMKSNLAEELGRADSARLWMDYELRGNDSVTPAIHAQLATARVLVLFLSTGYLESRWCMDELETFVARTRGQGGCIFPIYLSPVEQVPAPLQDLLKYQFWHKDERGQPRRLADPQPYPAREPEYYQLHRDLARDLARTLGQPRHSSRMPESSARDGDLSAATTQQTGDERPARSSIFVGGAQDDLDLVRHTARLLTAQGLRCLLPITAIDGFDPLTPSADIRRDLEESLEDSDAVLFLYRAGPATQVRQSIKEVRKLAARNPRVPQRIDLCQPTSAPDALGVYDPDLQVIGTPGDCGEGCARHCAQTFNDRLAAGGRP